MAESITISRNNEDDNHDTVKDTMEDIDIEEATKNNADEASSDPKENNADKQETTPFYKRRKVLVASAVAVVVIVIIALIPTVFLKGSSSFSGPHYSFSANFTTGPFTEPFRLARNGTRLFFDPSPPHTHVGVQIEVFDLEENGEWVEKSRLVFDDPFESKNGLNEGSKISAFDVSDDGRRIAAIVGEPQGNNRIVRKISVFEENSEGTEWFQVGESLDSDLLESLGLYSRKFDQCPPRLVDFSYPFYFHSISFSSDGNEILVANHDIHFNYKTCSNITRSQSVGGAIQVFQHADTASEEDRPQEFANSKWIPKGRMLLADTYYFQEGWAQNAVLAGNGMRIVSGGVFTMIFDYDTSTTNQWKVVDPDGIHILSNVKSRSDLYAVSHDGKTIAIAEADTSPSVYLEDPYRGEVILYTETGIDERGQAKFESFHPRGERGFQHFGTSIALNKNGDYIVVGSDNSGGHGRAKNFPEGDKLEVFSRNSTGGWNPVGPVLGHPIIGQGWKNVAIGPDGKRIAGVGREKIGSDPQVMVFDYQDE